MIQTRLVKPTAISHVQRDFERKRQRQRNLDRDTERNRHTEMII